jgi:TetR/AcrR family transcriptional repressor of nem operon
MRYSPGHKEATRKRLLELSSAMAKERGFGSMSVDTLMSAAGLTGGAFYAHFGSKEELDRSAGMLGPQEGETPLEWVGRAFDNYLTVGHVRHPESGCVLPALGAEIARAEPGVRKLYENAMTALKDRWAKGIGDPDVAWAIICQLIGTIVVARGMSSKRAMEEIIHASRTHLDKTIAAQIEQVEGAPDAARKA